MTPVQAILWGCLGGLLPDVLRLIKLKYKGAPNYLFDWFFWVSVMLLIGIAALAVYLLSPARVIDAVAIGFSAPEILSKALGARAPRPSTPERRERDKRRQEAKRGGGEMGALPPDEDGTDLEEDLRDLTEDLRDWWAS
jgi:hypothetical protein